MVETTLHSRLSGTCVSVELLPGCGPVALEAAMGIVRSFQRFAEGWPSG